METQEPEILTDALPHSTEENPEDILEKPIPEVHFVAFRNEVNKRFEKIERFLDGLKQQENAKLRDTAFDIPKDVKIGKKTFKLHRLPAGYRVLMMEKLQRIAELVPKQADPPVARLAELLQTKDERTPEQLAQELLNATRQPGLLAKIAPKVPEIFELMLEIIQLALHAGGKGKPEFDSDGKLKNPIIDIVTLKWECNDIEGIFSDIIEMSLPIFFTIQSVQRTLVI